MCCSSGCRGVTAVSLHFLKREEGSEALSNNSNKLTVIVKCYGRI